ncbi:lipopolysaccharide biosynthesis protein [Metabacillus indicus]|uniref:lipopolysaccharide biosynthesis protein n=1 Tax=Metabacillus indicus TaxID=246786 RepID=UPI00068B9DE1|nr:polysaccharide biosynthesis C-terminal domain-containing protein [Metabacillus indicus]
MILDKTKNTIRSSIWGLINRVVGLIFPFITRTFIIYLLGTEYVGLNSLFTSILSVLSLAELGFGTAIVYSMYGPIANGDNKKICALMNFYRKIYRVIGLIVLAIGIILIPFIPVFIKGTVPSDINVYIIYGLYLFNSVLTYWLFSYKICLLAAYQRNDILHKVSIVTNLAMYGLQIIFLCSFKNFYLFVACIPLFSAINNIVTSIFVSKLFPEYQCKGKIDNSEVAAIKKQVVGLLSQRLAFSSRNAFDSIIISSFLGLTIVGIYNNYFYILNALTAILSLIFSSMQGGIGNSIVKESVKKNYSNFRMINFMYMWIAGWCSISLLVLMQTFMKIWVGSNLMLPTYIVFLFAFYFLTMKMTDTTGAYIAGTGIWWNCRYTYLIEALVNLILNIALGYLWGVFGVIIATIISVVFVNYVSNTYILYKKYFVNENVKDIILDDLYYTVVVIIAGLLTYIVSSFLPDSEVKSLLVGTLLVKVLLCCILPNIIFYIMYRKNKQFIISKEWVLNKFEGKGSKKRVETKTL